MELIDKRDLKRELEFYCIGCNHMDGVKCRACDIGNAFDAIDDTHLIDAVPVVRCKDCRHGQMLDIRDRETDKTIVEAVYCELFDMGCSTEDYCSTGARMDGDLNGAD